MKSNTLIVRQLAILPRYAVFLLMALAVGCTSYYRIIDPTTKRIYYTTDYDRTESGGVEFHDARTGAKVTLQTSEIAKVTEREYRSKTK